MPSAARYVLKDSHPAIQEALIEEHLGKTTTGGGGDSDAINANDDNASDDSSIAYNENSKDIDNNNNKQQQSQLSAATLTSTTSSNNINDDASEESSVKRKKSISSVAAKGYRGALKYITKNATSTATTSPSNKSNTNDTTVDVDSVNNNNNLSTLSLSTSSKLIVQGRAYTTERAKLKGGIQLEEMTLGTKYAILSATDDNINTLRNVAKDGPWHAMGIKLIIQDSNKYNGTINELNTIEIYKPLTYLLHTYMDLTLDTHINITGWRGGHVIDTQGYIAHNDTTIVLSYRCTDTNNDWITNLSPTMSAWQSEDIIRGHSGVLSGLDFRSSDKIIDNNSNESTTKGRVHTGFYNFFIASVPLIKQYIDPLLADTSKPRTLYIVGHSLGGGIAYMALVYFLLEMKQLYNWENSIHKLTLVSVGSPRSYSKKMKSNIDNELALLKGKVSAIRLVRDKDCISSFPPSTLGFSHCNKFVLITKDDTILINPNVNHVLSRSKMISLLNKHPSIKTMYNDNKNSNNDNTTARTTTIAQDSNSIDDDDDENFSYYKSIANLPRQIRDHMPDSYLTTLIKLLQIERKNGYLQCIVNQEAKEENENENEVEQGNEC